MSCRLRTQRSGRRVAIEPTGIAYDQATNRISNAGWEYDAAGNQTRALAPGSRTTFQRFQYDAANRLVRVKDDNQTVIASYTYGADNQRLITEEFAQGTSIRTYYGLSVIAEYFESGGSTNPAWSVQACVRPPSLSNKEFLIFNLLPPV